MPLAPCMPMFLAFFLVPVLPPLGGQKNQGSSWKTALDSLEPQRHQPQKLCHCSNGPSTRNGCAPGLLINDTPQTCEYGLRHSVATWKTLPTICKPGNQLPPARNPPTFRLAEKLGVPEPSKAHPKRFPPNGRLQTLSPSHIGLSQNGYGLL